MIDKPFMTYDQLIDKMTEKGLEITDRSFVIEQLKLYSYFALVIGYKGPFKRKDGMYKPYTSFEDIFYLFQFDDSLRGLFLRYTLKIENHIKSLISYAFCSEYGESQQEYLNVNNYNYVARYQDGINQLVSKLSKLAKGDTDYLYINHQYIHHKNVPLWVMMKALTLGTVSKMYSFLKQSIQADVSKEFKGIHEGMLIRMLDLLSRVRNVCAHNERLFDYRYQKGSISDTTVHSSLAISQKNGVYVKGKTDLFAVVIVFKYLLNNEDFQLFVSELKRIIDVLFENTSVIPKEMLYRYMGFPCNWERIGDLEMN